MLSDDSCHRATMCFISCNIIINIVDGVETPAYPGDSKGKIVLWII